MSASASFSSRFDLVQLMSTAQPINEASYALLSVYPGPVQVRRTLDAWVGLDKIINICNSTDRKSHLEHVVNIILWCSH